MKRLKTGDDWIEACGPNQYVNEEGDVCISLSKIFKNWLKLEEKDSKPQPMNVDQDSPRTSQFKQMEQAKQALKQKYLSQMKTYKQETSLLSEGP